jgi:hypothetical protein
LARHWWRLATIAPFQTGRELLSAKREEQNLGRIAEADARLANVIIPSGVYFELSKRLSGGKERIRGQSRRQGKVEKAMLTTRTIAKSVVDHSKTPHYSIPILAFFPG